MKAVYRISDHSYIKGKIPGATKEVCLWNFFECFPNTEVYILKDKVDNPKTLKALSKVEKYHRVSFWETLTFRGGNAGTLRTALDWAIKKFDDEEIVYFVEDDYLHDPNRNPEKTILEPFNKRNARYVTLYDHPDKYQSEYNMGEQTTLFRTQSSHWKTTISTTMTFATKVKYIDQDMAVWLKYTAEEHPNDHQCFTELNNRSLFALVCAVPGISCHTDLTYCEEKGQNLVDRFALEYMHDKLYRPLYDNTPEVLQSLKELPLDIKKLAVMVAMNELIPAE